MDSYSTWWASTWRAWWAAHVIVATLFGFALNPWSAGATSVGEDAAAYALGLMGSPYVYGGSGPSTFDCSGMVQYVGAHLGVSLPRTAADQAGVSSPLAASLWSGELPVGALLFLADSAVGPGITHVSMYVGSNLAADCYNEQSGCVVHDVAGSAYYREHWVYATYPWGDTPAYGAGPNVATNTGPSNPGAGLAAIGQAIGQPGPLAAAAATPIAAMASVMGGVVGQSGLEEVDPLDADTMAHEHMAPVAGVISNAKMVDNLFPLKIVPLLAVVLLYLACKVALSFARYIIGLIPL